MQTGWKAFVYSALLVLAEASVLEDPELLEACDELEADVVLSDDAGLLELLAVSVLESAFDSEADALDEVLWLELALELLWELLVLEEEEVDSLEELDVLPEDAPELLELDELEELLDEELLLLEEEEPLTMEIVRVLLVTEQSL